MRASYFPDTDSLFIRFNEERIAETTDLGQWDTADFDIDGNLVAITIEHARERRVFPECSFEEVTAERVNAEEGSSAAAR